MTKREEAIKRKQLAELASRPLSYVSKHPTEFFSTFGSTIKFLSETKGSDITLSDDELLVSKTKMSENESFVAVNRPLNGTISLTLTSTFFDGTFCSCIGYVDPDSAQTAEVYKSLTGVIASRTDVVFLINGVEQEKSGIKLHSNDAIIAVFENDKTIFKTSLSDWTVVVENVQGKVFGIAVAADAESWRLSW
ncbi:hypothetical protein RCL1_009164 [Eukaryota sp. TZLM3-RCL]